MLQIPWGWYSLAAARQAPASDGFAPRCAPARLCSRSRLQRLLIAPCWAHASIRGQRCGRRRQGRIYRN